MRDERDGGVEALEESVAGPEASEPAVRLVNLRKMYAGDTVAVAGVDLDVRQGEFFAILGPSGSGKTTTLRMIGGFIAPSQGEIWIEGVNVGGRPPFQRNANTVFQSFALFPHLDVVGNVEFGLRMKRVARGERRRRALTMLDLVRLEGLAHRRISELSGGEQQRVALARALVNDPSVLLLDEPLGSLDLKLRRQMQRELKAIQERVGITFIHVTHDQEEALSLADRVGVMNEGRLLQVGTPKAIYDWPRTRFVADFIGKINIFEAIVTESEGDCLHAKADGVGEVFGVLPSDRDREILLGKRVAVGIRPERIQLRESETDETQEGGRERRRNEFRGRLERVTYGGSDYRYEVRLEEGALIDVSMGGATDLALPPSAGVGVRVWWSPEETKVIPEE